MRGSDARGYFGRGQTFFGGAVAIDGERMLVGSSGDREAGRLAGAVYAFDRSRNRGPEAVSSWAFVSKMAPDSSAGTMSFGRRIEVGAGAFAVARPAATGGTPIVDIVSH